MFKQFGKFKAAAALVMGLALILTLGLGAFAQTTTPGSSNTGTAAPNTSANPTPSAGAPPANGAGKQGGPGKHGGAGGPHGNSLIGAANIISATNADISYAAGKTDTGTAKELVSRAQALYNQAVSLNGGNTTTTTTRQVGETAAAAASAAGAAQHQLFANIGSTGMPSEANQPARPAITDTTTLKAHTSNDLARTYNNIVSVAAQAKTTGNLGDQSYYITLAQSAYKQAYNAYNAGNYAQASEYSHMAQGSIGVVQHLINALQPGAQLKQGQPGQVVTPPAPNFP